MGCQVEIRLLDALDFCIHVTVYFNLPDNRSLIDLDEIWRHETLNDGKYWLLFPCQEICFRM